MKKMITLKEDIINYAKNNSYFHINELRKYFTDRRIDYKNDTLKKYLYLLKTENVIYGAGRGWYSSIKEVFVLDTKPVEKSIALIKKKDAGYVHEYKIHLCHIFVKCGNSGILGER